MSKNFAKYKNYLPPKEFLDAYDQGECLEEVVMYYLMELLDTHFKHDSWHQTMIKTTIAMLHHYVLDHPAKEDDPFRRG